MPTRPPTIRFARAAATTAPAADPDAASGREVRTALDRFARWWRLRLVTQDFVARRSRPVPGVTEEDELRFPELHTRGPTVPAYRGLAGVWDGYAAAVLPDYPPLLAALARYHRLDLGSVLDLACGTGTLTVRLAAVAPTVVGLDASEPMLAVARGRPDAPAGVTWVRADFRDFTLDAAFDAAVCASNSLNYVADGGELRRVFAAVARHLRPGGLFVCDTATTASFAAAAGKYVHAEHGGKRFAMRFDYDATSRRAAARVFLPVGVETHRQIPLDPRDVVDAAAGSGLAVDDHFPRGAGAAEVFFVLRKPAN